MMIQNQGKDAEQRVRVPECFMSGRLGPQMAAGIWRSDLEALAKKKSAMLLGFTMDMTPSARGRILNEFAAAKSRADLVMQAKLCCFDVLPLKLLGLAHIDESVAARCAQEAVARIKHCQASLPPSDYAKLHSKIRFWASCLDDLTDFAD
eukprot:1873827-Alexandrium_andersonii.AAC.1